MKIALMLLAAVTVTSPAVAEESAPVPLAPFHVAFDGAGPGPVRLPAVHFGDEVQTPLLSAAVAQTAAPRRAVVYSEGYQKRDKIHHMASYAMLPLFGVEAYVGQKMFNDPSGITSGMQAAHRAVAWSIAGLFAVNSVTGVWNLVEARKDPNGLGRRIVHATLMLVADAGFTATAFTRPNSTTAEGVAIYTDKKNQHMALAYASVSVATVGYLIMLFK